MYSEGEGNPEEARLEGFYTYLLKLIYLFYYLINAGEFYYSNDMH